LICEDCAGPLVGPYNSFKGVATIARSLSLRDSSLTAAP
jgi:hypothetical protein